jgi:hypothetical protein
MGVIDHSVSYPESVLINLLENIFDSGQIIVSFIPSRVTVHRAITIEGNTILSLLFEATTETTVHNGEDYIRITSPLGFMRESCAEGTCSHGQLQPRQATPDCLA